jgi:hypothetical protein
MWANGGNLSTAMEARSSMAAPHRRRDAHRRPANTVRRRRRGHRLDQSSGQRHHRRFAAGDGIDLADLGSGAATTLAYTANADGSGGTLTASDGTHVASLALLGQYAASGFQAASDPGTGTMITYTPATTDPALLTQPQP